jgi:Phage integrase family
MESMLLDVAGHRRSRATMPGYHRGRPPRNKGEQYPADPPTVEEIVAVMRTIGDRAEGHRLRALIVLLWRAGLRISEALALQESDLDRSRGAVLIRRGKGGKRREVGMDRWAWEQLDPWLEIRHQLPIGALLCVIHGPTAGRRWEASAARKQLHHAERGRGETPLRATPTAPRSRGRNGARRRSARSHPASTWACQPGDHQRLPAGHRYQRDHQHRPRTALTNDLRHRRAPDDSIDQSATGSALVDVGPIRRYTPGRRDARQTSSTVPRPAFVWARAAEPARSS